jgi:Hint-domain/VWA / Hh  protein intein-like/von Willebrand factor type A domain/U-box domain
MEHHSLKMSIPSEFICPLTQDLFVNPVNCCVNGHIFDLGAINEWFHGDRDIGRAGNDTCPTCRAKLGSFRPERDLQRRVKEWKAANPGVVPAAPAASTGTQPFKDCRVKLTATDLVYQGRHRFVNVVAEADPSAARQPGVYILGLDYSGSMAELVDKTATEVFYTRMDLAKYTIRCVSRMLGPQDSLALVTFSTDARVAMEPTLMDDAGRRQLDHLLENVEPDASTNIDAAITTMMSVANSPELAGRAIFAALLTDGAETVIPHPTVGTVRWLTKQEMKNPWTLSTFGFGYELDSQLLKRIAEMPTSGSGVFGFIPDLSMIATVFINWAANCMSTGSRNAVINVNVNGTTATLNTGTLAIGQPRNFLVEVPVQGAVVKVSLDEQEVVPTPSDETYPLVWNAFTTAMEQVVTGMGLGKGVMTIYDELYYAHKGNMDLRVQALMRDVRSADSSEGQVGMAPQFWERWGAHYTRSYLRAQQVQRRLNFKDPGSLIYGDATFEALAAEGEKLFLGMEPPTPTGRGSGAVQTTSAQLSTYLRSATQGAYSGGCFSGDTQVLVGDGSRSERMPIKMLMPGDRVWTPIGVASVKAVVTMGHASAKSLMMSRVNGVIITPYHPYLLERDDFSEWVTGKDTVGDFEWTEPGLKLYNLVLDLGHIIHVTNPGSNLEGIEACTLAHGFKGPVIEHPFFGTEAVVECLSKAKGWERRMPYFVDLQVVRKNGLIVDWVEGDAPKVPAMMRSMTGV